MRYLLPLLLIPLSLWAQPKPQHSFYFEKIPVKWYEGLPIGNGWLGALVWQKNNHIRLSLDRADLWDDRPMPEIDRLTFDWVKQQVLKNEYDTVQTVGDVPYEAYAAPTKIPGAALEFDLKKLGVAQSTALDISNGLATILFANGVKMNNYVHATEEIGFFGFEHLQDTSFRPTLLIPNYNTGQVGTNGDSVEGQGLERLGYPKGSIESRGDAIRYHQPTYGGHYYEVLVTWTWVGQDHLLGQWTITVDKPAVLPKIRAGLSEPTRWPTHLGWWNDYWQRSSIGLPDTILETQYYRDMYKFGCVARATTPPISLQSIWTADNGNLPPWKGDFHHDLNTQLSYWPGYTANHLDLTASFTNWLWKVKPENTRWTKQYFKTEGLNVPGVSTITGKPMGGWIQYSMSPTTSAWVAQHFYWQWRYSMDEKFLNQRCRPYLKEVFTYLEQVMVKEGDKIKLPLSSSPEVFDNSINAWFLNTTNHDLALIRNAFGILSQATKDPAKWKSVINTLPALAQDQHGLTIAPGFGFGHSHRHHAHLMAIYPMKLLNPANANDKRLMDKSLDQLAQVGTRQWVGYSFAWAACLFAQAKRSDEAVDLLKKFATNFCSPNSFHLNGDQKGGQYSDFKYNPFTLEGNFAFAQGIHELLIQQHDGIIEIFPSIPKHWMNVSFHHLRTEGAFLVSAIKNNGVPESVTITAEQGGLLRIKLPFRTWVPRDFPMKKLTVTNTHIEVVLKKGQSITFENGYE